MKVNFRTIFNRYYGVLTLLIILGFALRFFNLGYSDYQGDEIKALFLPSPGQNIWSFLLEQRKGPMQFLFTFLLKFINPSYDNQFLIRLPFALAGVASIYFFYKTIKEHFGNRISLYATLFFVTNGFLIAFSRIVQYQSFTIFFMISSLYFLSLSSFDLKYKRKGIYFGLICWAFSILSHYDGFFIFPFVIYLLLRWLNSKDISRKDKLLTFIPAGFISVLILASFYIPFVLSIADSTKEYWELRMSGEGLGKISSSKYLFTVYQPIFSVHIYTALFILGISFIVLGLFSKYILKIRKLPLFLNSFFTHTTNLMKEIEQNSVKIYFLLAWILVSVLFYEKYVYVPGTHIFNYLIPMFVVLALGLVTLESLVFKIFEYPLVRIFNTLGIMLILLFLSAQSYTVFVDNYREYPWEDKNFLFWKLPEPNQEYYLTLFGFPYFRDWEGIRDFLYAHPDVTSYRSNEKSNITHYYLDLKRGSSDTEFYIYIKTPQSFVNTVENEKAKYWVERYDPVYTITRFGRDMVRIYIMEEGNVSDLIKNGF